MHAAAASHAPQVLYTYENTFYENKFYENTPPPRPMPPKSYIHVYIYT